jgi:hypothetical protein
VAVGGLWMGGSPIIIIHRSRRISEAYWVERCFMASCWSCSLRGPNTPNPLFPSREEGAF